MMTKVVKFINCYKIYCKGDIAKFPVEQANALILGNYAEELVPQMTKDAMHVAQVKTSEAVKEAGTELKAISKTNDKAVKPGPNKAKTAPKKGKK